MQALNLSFNPPPILETNRLLLKVATDADAPAILNLRGNAEVMQYLDRPLATNLTDALEYLQKVQVKLVAGDGISWGIFLKTNPHTLIGTMGLWRIDIPHYRAEIGYMLLPNFQRQGIMQEAITATIDYGFRTIGLHSIEAVINPNNHASKQLLLKNGFVQEAYFKENYFWNGKFLDSAVLSLLNSKHK